MKFLDDPGTGQCVGTLRWSGESAFSRLGKWRLPASAPVPKLTGWRGYIEMRMEPEGDTIRVEPPMLDGASYPLSLAYALQQLNMRPPSHGTLTVLIVGASSKAEERLVRDSNYWQELGHFVVGVPIELVFLGPEMAKAAHGRVTRLSPRLTARCFHGTLGALFAAEPQHTAESTLVVGFNTGMGNASPGMAKGGFPLMTSWLPDLIELLRRGIVAVFTCANDYSDLRGELAIFQSLLSAQLVLQPRHNPFKAATVVREGPAEICEWSCSSCYVYAVCGREEGARPLPPMAELLKSMRKLGKQLGRTQQASKVP